MPELPEVETVARQLDPEVQRRKLRRIEVRDIKLESSEWGRAKGYSIDKVRRVGKRVVFDLSKSKGSPLWIAVHLRMTGRLIWVTSRTAAPGGGNPGKGKALPGAAKDESPGVPKQPRLIFHLDGGQIQFHDTRRFGTVGLLDAEPQLTGPALDPLSRAFTAKAFTELLRDARGEIKPWMLRQDRIAGMGNIYASEALFAAGIDPRRSAGSLSPGEAKALRDSVADVMRRAVAKAGTTFSDYMDSRGKSGGFQSFLQVYGRKGQACPKCGEPIQQLTQQQRSTFFCSKCQR